MRNLITCLLRDERIQTTDPKAKEVRRWADRVITLGKRGSLHARRQALGIVRDKAVVRKLFDTLAPRFKDRPGGYTRIIKMGRRAGDGAELAIIELVDNARDKEAQESARKRTAKGSSKKKGAGAKTAESAAKDKEDGAGE